MDRADGICESAAINGSLAGTFLAWISDDAVSPSSRFVQNSDSYVLVDGTPFAANYSALTAGMVLTALAVNENGDTVPDGSVWSATLSDGTPTGGGTCVNWMDSDCINNGDVGSSGIPSVWTSVDTLQCDFPARVYCFEQ